jgi:hypothetical protein
MNETTMSIEETGTETVMFSDAAAAVLSAAQSIEPKIWIQEWPRVVVSIGASTSACAGTEDLSSLYDSVFAS